MMRRLVLLVAAIALAAVAVALTISPAGSHTAAASSTGADPGKLLLLFENAVHGWSVINVERGKRERVLRASYFDLSRSSDGSRVAFPCNWKDPTEHVGARALCVARVDMQSRQVVIRPLSGHDREPSSPEWSPDGRQLAFMWRSTPSDPAYVAELWTVRGDGSDQRRIATGTESHPFWSPDGSLIAYSVLVPGDPASGMYVMRPDGSERLRITAEPGTLTGNPHWSPRGSLIAYVQNAPGTQADGIYVARPTGSQRRRLVTLKTEGVLPELDESIRWSSTDRSIAYAAYTRPGSLSAFVVDVTTGRRTTLGRGRVSFSPSGSDMLLVTEAPIPDTLYRGRVTLIHAGGRLRSLLDERVMAYGDLGWSRDGKRVAYMKRNGLWVVDLATRKAHRVLRWNLPPNQSKGPLIWR